MALNLKKLTIQNIKAGIHTVTPLQLCESRIIGYYGTVFGILIAAIPLALTHQWGWIIFMFFVGWLQCSALVGDIQQRKLLKEAEEQVKSVLDKFEKDNGGIENE